MTRSYPVPTLQTAKAVHICWLAPVGRLVPAGSVIAKLECEKVEHDYFLKHDAIVRAWAVRVGDVRMPGAPLLEVDVPAPEVAELEDDEG